MKSGMHTVYVWVERTYAWTQQVSSYRSRDHEGLQRTMPTKALARKFPWDSDSNDRFTPHDWNSTFLSAVIRVQTAAHEYTYGMFRLCICMRTSAADLCDIFGCDVSKSDSRVEERKALKVEGGAPCHGQRRGTCQSTCGKGGKDECIVVHRAK